MLEKTGWNGPKRVTVEILQMLCVLSMLSKDIEYIAQTVVEMLIYAI
jgi:hypothetical protein